MFDLEMTEDQRLIHDTVASFAKAEIRPIAHDCDESGTIPAGLAEKGFELGLVHSAIPEEQGGYGETRSAVTGAIVAEELAWGDLAIAMHLLTPRLLVYPLLEAGCSAAPWPMSACRYCRRSRSDTRRRPPLWSSRDSTSTPRASRRRRPRRTAASC